MINDESRSQREVAVGAVFTRADQYNVSRTIAVNRKFTAMENIGFLIGEGKNSKARRIYERNKDWMTLPTSALNILYPEK